MNNIFIAAASEVTAADLATLKPGQRLGQRFGRLDLQSQLALLAVESLGVDFSQLPRERIGICLETSAGSLTTDLQFWQGRTSAGGPSPLLFAYTLPSSAIGEIAIQYKLTGPNLCWVGDGRNVLPEAFQLVERREADACVAIFSEVISEGLSPLISRPPAALARAVYLQRGKGKQPIREFDRDMKALCKLFSRAKSAV